MILTGHADRLSLSSIDPPHVCLAVFLGIEHVVPHVAEPARPEKEKIENSEIEKLKNKNLKRETEPKRNRLTGQGRFQTLNRLTENEPLSISILTAV